MQDQSWLYSPEMAEVNRAAEEEKAKRRSAQIVSTQPDDSVSKYPASHEEEQPE